MPLLRVHVHVLTFYQSNKILRPVDGSGSWRTIPGSLSYITASGYDEVFGVNSADKICRCKKPCVGELELIDERMKQCDATNNGLFGVNDHNNVFRYNLS